MSNWPNIPSWDVPTPPEGDYPEWHSVYTIQLGELMENGYFNWNMVEWDGIGEHTQRLKDAFEKRFYFCEISMLPPLEWLKRLGYVLEYELTPKYAPLYDAMKGVSVLASETEYKKSRDIHSAYPETILDGTEQAYASDGRDYEEERIKNGDISEKLETIKKLKSLDALFLDELETLFIGLYTTHINGY